METEKARGPVIDGRMIVAFANAQIFGFYVKGLRVKGLLQKKVEEITSRQSWEGSVDEPINGSSSEGDDGQTLGDLIAGHGIGPDEEVEAKQDDRNIQTAQDERLSKAISSLKGLLTETKNAGERETLKGILAYAEQCAAQGTPVVLSSVGIELVTGTGTRDLVPGVRLVRCLSVYPSPSKIPSGDRAGVSVVPKTNWKTSKALEEHLHGKPDGEVLWASANQAAIHKRIIRALSALKTHALVTEILCDEEDV